MRSERSRRLASARRSRGCRCRWWVLGGLLSVWVYCCVHVALRAPAAAPRPAADARRAGDAAGGVRGAARAPAAAPKFRPIVAAPGVGARAAVARDGGVSGGEAAAPPPNATAHHDDAAKNGTKHKKNHTKHHRRRKARKRTSAPTAAPTLELAAASVFPFSRGERYVRRGLVQKPLSGRSRRFRVGPRKDLENFVAPLLSRMGLLETFGMDWDVYVGLQFKPDYEKNYLLAPNGSAVSSIPGLKEVLGDKEAFTRLWRRCLDVAAGLGGLDAAQRRGLCSWTTPSLNAVHKRGEDGAPKFAVEGGADAFEALLLAEGPSTWIVKPQRRYLSLGMHLAALNETDLAGGLATLAAWARRETPLEEKKKKHHTKQPGEFTMQRYVERPARLAGRKFDLRLWTLVASLEPLAVYVLDVAFPKISVQDYRGWDLPRNASTLDEKCMHILMMASEFCLKRMTFPKPWPFEYPGVTRPDLAGDVGGRSFFEALALDGGDPPGGEASWRRWQEVLWPALERTVLTPLLLAKPGLHEHEARIYGAGGAGAASGRTRRFALLSPDAIWDSDAGIWRLEEINTNGLFQLGADDPAVKTFHVDEGYTEGWLQIAGVDGYPNRRRYEGRLAKALDAFCAAEGCDDADRGVLRDAAHQNAHASSGWYRAWPPVDCGAKCGSRPDLAADPGLKAAFVDTMTPLAKKHWRFLRGLDAAYFASPSSTRDGSDRDAFPHFLDPD